MAKRSAIQDWQDRWSTFTKAWVQSVRGAPPTSPVLPPHVGIPSLGDFIAQKHNWERVHRDFHLVGMQRAKDIHQKKGITFGGVPEKSE